MLAELNALLQDSVLLLGEPNRQRDGAQKNDGEEQPEPPAGARPVQLRSRIQRLLWRILQSSDGMLEGPNFSEIENLLGVLRCQLIASGGVSSAEDVRRLGQFPTLYGTIIGKALYDGKVSLQEIAKR